ncbi:MAG: hypothetical protein OXF84_10480 [Bacteroidetes bacterium]|nr:hypothetical protein [Bacteroidota bacterium]
MKSGNSQAILCERGIRTFEVATRHTLDLSGSSVDKAKSHLSVIVYPSQGVGIRDYVVPLSSRAVAAGVIIDGHDNLLSASERGLQALRLDQFSDLFVQAQQVAHAVGRDFVEV